MSTRATAIEIAWTISCRDGILRERLEHARGRNLADCGRICGGSCKSIGSIEEMFQMIKNMDCHI